MVHGDCCFAPQGVRTDMGGARAPLYHRQGADIAVWLTTLQDLRIWAVSLIE